MNSKFSQFIKRYPEKYLARAFGKIFWPPPSVAVLVHGENNDILALNLNNSYRLPGGFIEQDEELKEAAEREVKEETGFIIDVGELLDIRQNDGGGPQFFFEGKVKEGEQDGGWEGQPEFIPKTDVANKVWKLEHSHIHDYLFSKD